MIARIWHGWTKRTDAKAYENMLRDEIFPNIAAQNIHGYEARNCSFAKIAMKSNSLRCFALIPWMQ